MQQATQCETRMSIGNAAWLGIGLVGLVFAIQSIPELIRYVKIASM